MSMNPAAIVLDRLAAAIPSDAAFARDSVVSSPVLE
jgi:hypothetical protein